MLSRKSHRRISAATILIFVICVSVFGQPESIYKLPAGTRLRLKLDAELNSRVASVGDTFVATLTGPVKVREAVVVPAGTTVEGRVTEARAAGSGGVAGKLDLSFVSLRYSSEMFREIDGDLVARLTPERSSHFGLFSVLGGAGLGGLLGGLTGSGRNAVIGTGIGAGIGALIAAGRKGRDVKIGKNVEFEIELKKEVVLPVQDY